MWLHRQSSAAAMVLLQAPSSSPVFSKPQELLADALKHPGYSGQAPSSALP